MNKLHQLSKHTSYDRYPDIFSYAKKIVKEKNPFILSYGCSTGEEIRTLKEIYFPNSVIYGVDIDINTINNNRKNNGDSTIVYMTPHELFSSNIIFDIVFCMSVFCRWPEKNGDYPFEIFEQSITELDKFIKPKTGLLVIYNSKYLFTDTTVSKKYQPLNTFPEIQSSGFVTKYHKKGNIVDNYFLCIFEKK